MLSIQECRNHIENNQEYTDKEMTEIRDYLYELADLMIDTVPNVDSDE